MIASVSYCRVAWSIYQFLGFPGDSVVKNPPAMQETWILSMVREILWRRKWQHTPVFFWEIPSTEEPGGHKESDMT